MEIFYRNNSLIVHIPRSEGTNKGKYTLQIMGFDFAEGTYKEYFEGQVPNDLKEDPNGGYFYRSGELSSGLYKCLLKEGDSIVESRLRYTGDKKCITISAQSELMRNEKKQVVYTLVSSINLARNLIYYDVPEYDTKVFFPHKLEAHQEYAFIIEKDGFEPAFKCVDEVKDSIDIRWK